MSFLHLITPAFERELRSFPLEVRELFNRRLEFMRDDLRHPSIRIKKFGGFDDLWQGRLNSSIRFYFKVSGGKIIFLAIKKHK